MRLLSLLGDLPSFSNDIKSETISIERCKGYILETLVLDLNRMEPVPAYFVKPHDATQKTPVILYNHAHGGDYKLGKDELINGCNSLQSPPYADALTSMGYSVLCIDCWAFGERRGRTEAEIFKEMLWNGRVMWGMMVYDSLRAIDYLVTRKDIDSSRIGTLGLSMGSTMAWWVAALDERIKVCVDICCLTDFHSLIKAGGLNEHGIYYYVPSLLKHFTTLDINAMIAPRAHLSIAGIYDRLTPLEGLDIINRGLTEIYSAEGAPGAWRLSKYKTGHYETAQMRKEITEFLKSRL